MTAALGNISLTEVYTKTTSPQKKRSFWGFTVPIALKIISIASQAISIASQGGGGFAVPGLALAFAPIRLYSAYASYRSRVKKLRDSPDQAKTCFRLVKILGDIGNVVYETLKPLAAVAPFWFKAAYPVLGQACPIVIAVSATFEGIANIWSLKNHIVTYLKLSDPKEIQKERIKLLKKVIKVAISITVLTAAIFLIVNPYMTLPALAIFMGATALSFVPLIIKNFLEEENRKFVT